MIKYCCFYCIKLNKDCPSGSCYNALGGKDYMTSCEVKDGICAEKFNQEGGTRKPVAECNKDCWVANPEGR